MAQTAPRSPKPVPSAPPARKPAPVPATTRPSTMPQVGSFTPASRPVPPPPPPAFQPVGFGKRRNPVVVALLILVTIGIYSFVWYYKINKEASSLSGKRSRAGLWITLWISGYFLGLILNITGGVSNQPALQLTGIIIQFGSAVFTFVLAYITADNIEAALTARGITSLNKIVMFLLMAIIVIVGGPVAQAQMNKLWPRA